MIDEGDGADDGVDGVDGATGGDGSADRTDAVDRVRPDRYASGLAAAVALAAAGILSRSPVLLVGAAVPVGFVAYGAAGRLSVDPATLTIEREIDRTTAFPGDRVTVTLRVTNEGDRRLGDVRVADGVPDSVSVVEGVARGGAALDPGEATTVEYAVVARRGRHEFGPARVRLRNAAGTDVVTITRSPEGPASLSCRPDVESVPLTPRSRQFTGDVAAATGGSGVEFHSTREYRSGDPVNRIDWRRLARTGEVTTVDYRERRSTRVVVVVDARASCHVAPAPGAPTGAAMCSYGARRVTEALTGVGHVVGVAVLGLPDRVDADAGGPAWAPPDGTEESAVRARQLFERAADPPADHRPEHAGDGFSRTPDSRPVDPGADRNPDGVAVPTDGPDTGGSGAVGAVAAVDSAGGETTPPGADLAEALCGRLPPDARLLVFSPVLDRVPETVTRTAVAHGHPVTVVSPDVTVDDGTASRLRRVERRLLLEEIGGAGANVVDWDRDRPLAVVLESVLEAIE